MSNDDSNMFEQNIEAIGYQPYYPPKAIRGVHLNDQQYDDYVRISGRLSKASLQTLFSHPEWPSIPDPSKLSIVNGIVQKSRDIAQTAVMLKSQGSQNDIIQKATDAKLARLQSSGQDGGNPHEENV